MQRLRQRLARYALMLGGGAGRSDQQRGDLRVIAEYRLQLTQILLTRLQRLANRIAHIAEQRRALAFFAHRIEKIAQLADQQRLRHRHGPRRRGQQGTQALAQALGIERFGQIGTGRQRPRRTDAAGIETTADEHERQRRRTWMTAQLTQQFQTIEPRQLAIGDHQVRQSALAACQCRLAITDLQHAGITAHIEHQLPQQIGRPGIRFSDQNFHTMS